MKTLTSLLFISLVFSGYTQTFSEEEVSIGDLKGTLSVPKAKTKTAVLMISGSGPTDRDGNSAMGLNNNSLKMVAQSISEAGYTVLRYDKRGIAKSKAAVEDQTSVRFDHFVEDTRNWLNLLSEKGYKNLVIIGHSQGSLVGMLAAQKNENVKGFISIAGLAEDAGAAIVRQISAQSPPLGEDARLNMDSLKNGHTVKTYSPYLASIFNPQIQPFLKSYVAYSPAQEIQKLEVPALIINGTNDIQVGQDQAKELKQSYPSSELLIIEGMNHVLKDTPDGDLAANMATYNNPDLPLSDGLMTGIISFIEKL